MTGYFNAGPRQLQPGDAEAVRILVWSLLGVTPYVDRVGELLDAAQGGDRESRALVIERDGTVAAVASYGPVAASQGTWQLNMVLVGQRVDLREVGHVMIDAVAAHARREGARLLMAELPADPVLGRTLSLLRANGFRQEGRIPDFYRDGVALVFLRRELIDA